jgi:tRNA(Arg) A34 adenosine deaminase TadA
VPADDLPLARPPAALPGAIGPAEALVVTLPPWLVSVVAAQGVCVTDAQRMQFAVRLAQENVARGTGGPFGAAVFEEASGRLVGAGVNLVERSNNAVLHAEVVALMFAQRAVASHTLAAPPVATAHMLATSCAPCAMCLGAVHWSGVCRVLIGATREDAMAIGFDEGPVFPESVRYLEARGIVFTEGVERDAARAVLQQYQQLGGPLYNA